MLFRWRRAVASPLGPKKGPTRHVLLTLSLHMDELGGSCFPSTSLLKDETGLTRKTVESHLRAAAGEWITRTERMGEGRSWRRFEYQARFPDGWVGDTQPQASEVGYELPSPSGRGGVGGTQPQSDEVGYVVPKGGVPATQPQSDEVGYFTTEGGVNDDLRLSNSRPEVGYDVPMRTSLGRHRGRQEENRAINPPAPSDIPDHARDRDEAGGQEEYSIPKSNRIAIPHPALNYVWDDVRTAIFETWHHGIEVLEVHEHRIGIGLERAMTNDLLDRTGDPDFVRWLIVDAPAALGWDTEPRTLRWAHREQNLAQARTAYFARNPIEPPAELVGKTLDPPAAPPTDQRARALAQMAHLRAEAAADAR